MKLTSNEYVAKHGNECPSCLSVDIRSTESMQHDEATCWQECKCNDCDAEWTDEYSLTGYSTPVMDAFDES